METIFGFLCTASEVLEPGFDRCDSDEVRPGETDSVGSSILSGFGFSSTDSVFGFSSTDSVY